MNSIRNRSPFVILVLINVYLLIAGNFSTRAAEKDAAAKDLEKLQGEWVMLSGLADGGAVPEDMLRTSSRVCKGNETSVTIGSQLIMRAKFTIDPSKTPKNIDYDVLEGPAKGGKMLGINELEGSTVKFCFGAPGAERPSKFESQLGQRRTFSVWERKKGTSAAAPVPSVPVPAKPPQK